MEQLINIESGPLMNKDLHQSVLILAKIKCDVFKN